MSGWSILPLPKPEQLSALGGMRTRLEGTQTRGAGESHAQEANVAEVSYGETVIVEPEYPDKSSATRRSSRAHWGDVPLTRRHKPDKQVTNGVVGSKSERDHISDPSDEHAPTTLWGNGCKPRHNLLYASASLSRLGMTGVIPRLAAPVFYPTLGPCTTSCSVLCLRRGSHAEQNSGGLAHR